MRPVFIFAEHIRKALGAGKKEIEIPQGARISAAADEMIRDNKLRVIYVDAAKGAAETEGLKERPVSDELHTSRSVEESDVPEDSERDTPAAAGGEISTEILEEIVERVMTRFKELKGFRSGTVVKEGIGAEIATDDTEGDDLVICRCEEITRGEIRSAIRNGMMTLNGVKRVTRAGMGLCQGQTCQRLVTQILADELGISAAEIDPTTARGPVRPLRLEVFANS